MDMSVGIGLATLTSELAREKALRLLEQVWLDT